VCAAFVLKGIYEKSHAIGFLVIYTYIEKVYQILERKTSPNCLIDYCCFHFLQNDTVFICNNGFFMNETNWDKSNLTGKYLLHYMTPLTIQLTINNWGSDIRNG
jgi:hypothetical protein